MGSITIIGAGSDNGTVLSSDTAEKLRRAQQVVVSRADGSVSAMLSEAGIEHTSFSELGLPDTPGTGRVVELLADIAAAGDVAYVTNGYPFLRHGLLSELLLKTGTSVRVFPSLSSLYIILMAFDIDLTADLNIMDARSYKPLLSHRASHLVIAGIRNRLTLAKLAERLTEVYSPDHDVVVASTLEDGGFSLSMTCITNLADMDVSPGMTLYLGPRRIRPPAGFQEFVRLIEHLRGPNGCVWDRGQNHLSLRRHLLEEAHETIAAIESGSPDKLAEELGDVLLQVVLHSQIASESGCFTIEDVISSITTKIRRRHPHVFGDAVANTAQEVTAGWNAIKLEENQGGLLDDVPTSLPALMLAQSISRKVVGAGFEWETIDDVWAKIHEEIDELKAVTPGSPQAAEEVGDLLFTVVNLARKQGIDAEEALKASCAKFKGRWQDMESAADQRSAKLHSMSAQELEALWVEAKKKEGQDSK